MRFLPCLIVFTTTFSFAISQENLKIIPPFDGKTLQGWDGNEKVWRVKDGVIVGGSFENNPKNEFLTYKTSFKNY
ncbi:MAG: family 16 glycoside hydrolase, partial [Gemmataceae bacterium]